MTQQTSKIFNKMGRGIKKGWDEESLFYNIGSHLLYDHEFHFTIKYLVNICIECRTVVTICNPSN